MNNTSAENFPKDPPLARRPRAVVIGASSGIGAALTHHLANQGMLVAALARREDLLDSLCAEINAQAGEKRAVAYPHDVTDIESIPALFQRILADLGGIDHLIYVAGATIPVAIDEFDLAKEQDMLQINLLGGIAWLGQAAALFQTMKAGQIVGISSVAADRGRVTNPAYNASKAGLDVYLEGLRNRLTRHGVHVLTVRPGFVDTDVLKASKITFGVISPQNAAAGVWRAMQKRRQLVYLPWWWRWLMLAIRLTPSFIFRRLSF